MVDISDEVFQKMIKKGDKVIHIDLAKYGEELWTVKHLDKPFAWIAIGESDPVPRLLKNLKLVTKLGRQMEFPFMYEHLI